MLRFPSSKINRSRDVLLASSFADAAQRVSPCARQKAKPWNWFLVLQASSTEVGKKASLQRLVLECAEFTNWAGSARLVRFERRSAQRTKPLHLRTLTMTACRKEGEDMGNK